MKLVSTLATIIVAAVIGGCGSPEPSSTPEVASGEAAAVAQASLPPQTTEPAKSRTPDSELTHPEVQGPETEELLAKAIIGINLVMTVEDGDEERKERIAFVKAKAEMTRKPTSMKNGDLKWLMMGLPGTKELADYQVGFISSKVKSLDDLSNDWRVPIWAARQMGKSGDGEAIIEIAMLPNEDFNQVQAMVTKLVAKDEMSRSERLLAGRLLATRKKMAELVEEEKAAGL